MAPVYAGIDWASSRHKVYATDDSAKPLDSFTITHTPQGLQKLQERLSRFGSSQEVLIAIETQDGLLVSKLLEMGFTLHLINPKVMDRYRDRYRMAGSKSDPQDAMVLANILRTDRHLYPPLSPQGETSTLLRKVTRQHKALVEEKVRVMNQMATCLSDYYLVALDLFSSLDQPITLAFLERYPTPEKARAASKEELAAFFTSHHYPCPRKIDQIYEQLQAPALTASLALAQTQSQFLLCLISLLRSLLVALRALEKSMAQLLAEHPDREIFQSLPGAGLVIASRLAAEMGTDRSRFPHPQALQAQGGVCPVTRSSGNHRSIYFRRHCNKHLRDALQKLARESVRHCPWAATYFQEQLKRGHLPSRAYRALAKGWAAILWRMWHDHQPYSQARLGKRLAPATTQPSYAETLS